MPAIAQNNIADFSDRKAIDEHIACRYMAVEACRVLRDLNHTPVLRNQDVEWRHAQFLGHSSVLDQVPHFSVNGNEIPRPRYAVQDLQLLLTRVSRNVHVRLSAVNDPRAELVEVVDIARHKLFVTRNRGRGENDRISLSNLNLAVVTIGHAAQRRGRLAPGSRG